MRFDKFPHVHLDTWGGPPGTAATLGQRDGKQAQRSPRPMNKIRPSLLLFPCFLGADSE